MYLLLYGSLSREGAGGDFQRPIRSYPHLMMSEYYTNGYENYKFVSYCQFNLIE